MNAPCEIKIRTAEEGAIVVAKYAKLEDGNQRHLGAARHADFLAACLRRGGQHGHGNDLRIQPLVRSRLDLAILGLEVGFHAPGARLHLIVLPRDAGDIRLQGAQVTDVGSLGGLHRLESRRQVSRHLFDAALGIVVGEVILEVDSAHFTFGIDHHHQADGDAGHQQQHQQSRNQRESP